ncbi:MAG: glycogen-binding domain-containing protein [Gemmatimonadota bacterium]|nr:MAG: glycogen-binding domain-containing protein [Gemmatimonadota bacterium]
MTRTALLCVSLVALQQSSAAQEVSVLLGGVHTEYADSISGDAGTISLRLGGSSARAIGVADASITKFVDGVFVTQGSAYGTLLLTRPNWNGPNLLLAGGLDGNYIEQGSVSGGGSVGPVLGVAHKSLLTTLGASVGFVRTVAESSFVTGTANLKARIGFPAGFSLAAGAVVVTGDTIGYVDGTIELGYDNRRLRSMILGGARTGDLANDPWLQVRVNFMLVPTALLEFAFGSYPKDLVGFEQGTYASAGVRVNLSASARAPYRAPPPPPLSIQYEEVNRVRIVVHYPGSASQLDIAGDWTDWDPLPMQLIAPDLWEVITGLESGIYRYSLIVNGSEWVLPEGVPSEPDGLGGTVGLLVVRRY